MSDSSAYPAPTPHDAIEEVFPDVYMVHGSFRMAPGMQISRNMAVVRQNGELTILNTVRLSPEGETALEALGTVKNVVRLGAFHGVDDPYYVDHYSANFWCQAGSKNLPKATHLLEQGSELPLADAELFTFQETTSPECAILLRQHGGVLMTCDSIQHYTDWSYCSLAAKMVLKVMGFSQTTLVGPPWKKRMTPKGGSIQPDFQRLLELDFKHLIAAHGRPCRDSAHDQVQTAVANAFGA